MPYRIEWEEPEIFLEHNGIKIYCTYDDDDVNDRLFYWYTTSDEASDVRDVEDFDVRNLPGWTSKTKHILHDLEAAKVVIREAIDAGLITQDGYQGDKEN